MKVGLPISRRLFLQRSAGFITGVLGLAGLCARQTVAAAFQLVSETDALPAALKFKQDANKVPQSARTKGFDQQRCHSCTQYRKKGEFEGSEVGSCNLFSSGVVRSNGWCSSWAKA